MKCKFCGEELQGDSKFCTHCGKSQNTSKSYEFTGSTYGASTIIIENGTLTIKRKGVLSFLNKGFSGEKKISIKQITGTQYKPAGLNNGYLQFLIMGSHEIKGGLKAAQHDENTVVWAHKNQNKNAAEIIEYINNYNNSDSQANNNVNIIQSDNYDKLIKLKKLLDDNIITQEEFEKEKTKLLG